MDLPEPNSLAYTIMSAMADCQGSSAYSLDRDRPYDGQTHTVSGERGKALVEGLTMRDVADCIVRGFLDAAGIHRKNPIRDDLFAIPDLDDLDPVAIIQNTACWIERYMGIYPNVPKLLIEPTDQSRHSR